METADDNGNQGSFATEAYIPTEHDVLNQNSRHNVECSADDTVGMATHAHDSILPLNSMHPRSENLVPAHVKEEQVDSQRLLCTNSNSIKDAQDNDENKSKKDDWEDQEEEGQDHNNKLAFNSEACVVSSNKTTELDATFDSEDDTSKTETGDCDDRSQSSTPQFTIVLNSEDSLDRNSPDPTLQTSEVVENGATAKSIISDKDSQSTHDVQSSTPVDSAGRCCIKLDVETFKEWMKIRRKKFVSDVEMAKFLMRRFVTHDYKEEQDSQESVQGKGESLVAESSQYKTRQSDTVKKKSIFAGGIESIVQRLHQVRTETGDSQPEDSDSDNIVGSRLSDIKVKTEPVENVCNISTEGAASTSIPKKATTAIYLSSGRNGRKRVPVKREPDAYGLDQDEQEFSIAVDPNDQQQSEVSNRNHFWPVRIKQEPLDLSESQMMTGGSCSLGETHTAGPGPLGQFVKNAASWVTHLVASELKKPKELATDIPEDTPGSIFSDRRLHRIIEEQLSQPSKTIGAEYIPDNMIEKEQMKPVPTIDTSFIKIEKDQDNVGLMVFNTSKQARKEMKRARREARQAKKLKKSQKREKALEKYVERNQSPSSFGRSSSETSSPFEKLSSPFEKSISPLAKSLSPFEKPSNQESISASHCLESFARMVQIREFKGSCQLPLSLDRQRSSPVIHSPGNIPTSQVLSTQIQRSPPIPSNIGICRSPPIARNIGICRSPPTPSNIGIRSPVHILSSQVLNNAYSPQTHDLSPPLNTSNVLTKNNPQQVASTEHLASQALKSFAQRSANFVQPEMEDDRGDPPSYHEAIERPGIEGNSTRPEMLVDTPSQPTGSPRATPLEQLLKVSEAPAQTTAKSQLEQLLKTKNVKDKWAGPSAFLSRQVPYHVPQAHTSYSPHILKVPKVTFSGRTINDTSQESFLKAPAIDRLLASTCLSSDSEDSDSKEAIYRSKDPDWCPSTPKRSRKRSLPRIFNTIGDGKQVSSNGNTALVSNMVGNNVSNAVNKENGEALETHKYETRMKHQRLDEEICSKTQSLSDNGKDKSTELSATSTLAKLLQMANKKNQENNPESLNQNLTTSTLNESVSEKDMGHTYQNQKRDFTAKSSAFGAMQAFAQLVEIQGISPAVQKVPTDEPLNELPNSKLSHTLPPIMQDVNEVQKYDVGIQLAGVNNVINGAQSRDNAEASLGVNGGYNEPEDLTMHSKVRIKVEPVEEVSSIEETQNAARRLAKHQHRVNLLNKQRPPMRYTCSLCSKIFNSKTEVTEHKMIIHYSSGCEMVS